MTTAARDGGSARDLGSVMMRHGSSLVSVGAVRPPVAPAEPPSVAAGESRGVCLPKASVRLSALPGHARPGRRHIYSGGGELDRLIAWQASLSGLFSGVTEGHKQQRPSVSQPQATESARAEGGARKRSRTGATTEIVRQSVAPAPILSAGYCTGQAHTGVKPPFASLHRLGVQRSRVIVSAQGNHSLSKESVSLVESFDAVEEQPGGVGNRPAGHSAVSL